MKSSAMVTFSISSKVKVKNDLEKISKKYGISRGALIRYVLKGYLDVVKKNNYNDNELKAIIDSGKDLRI